MCPFTGLLGLGALVGGSERWAARLRVRPFVIWSAAAVLAAAWVAYFGAARTLPLRVTLEVLSVAFLTLAPGALRAARRANAPRFAALERFATEAPAGAACPLGFGGGARPAATAELEAAFAPRVESR